MDLSTKGWTLAELAALLGGDVEGPGDLRVYGPGAAKDGNGASLGFAQNEKFLQEAAASGLGAVLISRDAPKIEKPAIRVDRPRDSFTVFLNLCAVPLPLGEGVHPTAVISPEAEVDPSARIGAYVIIERCAKVAAKACVFPFVYVGERCDVGEGAVLYPHAVLYQDVKLGDRAVLHAGVVVGADGFGFQWNGKEQVKIPQVGRTEIGEDVEIGANSTVDRATMGATRIHSGVKIDNLVMVGHNSEVGSHTVIAGQAGISGSSSVGDRCTLAGQTGLCDHVTVGDDVILTARSAVTKDLPGPGPYRGAPAMPYMETLRYEAALRRVPELLKRIKELEERLEKLEIQKPNNEITEFIL